MSFEIGKAILFETFYYIILSFGISFSREINEKFHEISGMKMSFLLT
jgi:hypothetical protein